jgi:hypothetical protein
MLVSVNKLLTKCCYGIITQCLIITMYYNVIIISYNDCMNIWLTLNFEHIVKML